ncbi:tRNA (adenine(58)-N(1))-methyltransferase non-catalytic subunit TRM6 [Toxocara canis]|uniref:tRNA (adenine(58)-N(1))-methyltransferase non-catalytic subunit TRM6 n=1 Tax=Toxocara canis TaxID=6265 RepID=A0A0B2VQB3_TOXCA|nr:tRNA (adenine(58)-N(1))-methyltransferase non-catalytic subunit TRM6 [Toxocara canis]
MITPGCHVVIQKLGGEHIRVCELGRKRMILIEKLRFNADGALNQPFGLFEVSAGQLTRACEEMLTNAESIGDIEPQNVNDAPKTEASSVESTSASCSSVEEGGRNAAQVRQRLTQEDISNMKSTGVSAGELVAKLVDGNVAFSERTVYAKSKYIRRKTKKHSDRVLILKPTVRLIAESYYKKDPDRVANLRIDMLAQVLLLGGIRSGYKCVVFEQCLGLLTAAVLERLGGEGACVHIHRGLIAQAIPCVQSMDFDSKVYSTFLPLRITTLLNGSIEEHEEKNDTTSQDGAASEATLARRADRLHREKMAWELMSNKQIDCLLIAVKGVDPIDVLEHTWDSLRLASTLVLYSPICEPLMAAYSWLKEKGAVNVQMCDSFHRSYQESLKSWLMLSGQCRFQCFFYGYPVF